MSINIHFTNSIEELKTYKSLWEKLCDLQYDNLGVLNQWDYFESYILTHIQNTFTVALITSKENNELIGIFPLRIINLNITDKQTLKIAVSMGSVYCPYLEYIIHPNYRKEVWESLFSVLKTYHKFDGIVIGPLHETSLNYVHLLESLNKDDYSRLTNKTLYQVNPQIMTFENYVKTRSTITIKDAKRGKKQLEKQGVVKIVNNTMFEDAQKSIKFHVDKMKEKFKDKIYYDYPEGFGNIFSNMIKIANEENKTPNVQIIDLLLDDKIIASSVTLKYKNRNLFMLTAYDKEYSVYSPSKILLDYLITQSLKKNEIFCLGANNCGYKEAWSNQIYNLNVLCYFLNDNAKELWLPYVNWVYIGNIIRES